MHPADYSIYAHRLSHRYGVHTVLDNVDFQVERGEFFGFLGRNGAGKSTAIRALCGLLPPSEGEIRVAGIDVIKRPAEARRQIGIVSEDIALYERLTGREFLEFAGRMHGLSGADARARAGDLMERMNLTGAAERAIAGYSLGMKKKTAFAAALIHAPRVLFLDEPFNGVDAASTHTLCALLQHLAEVQGVTVFFTSHVIEAAERLCSRVAVLQEGRIVRQGTIAALKADAIREGMTLEEVFLHLTGADTAPVAPLTWY